MKYKDFATSSLIEKCIEQDGLAWAEFIKRFSPLISFSIKKALSKYSVDFRRAHEDMKDIHQNIMTTLWGKNKLAEVINRDNINYWLVVTARNATINHLKAFQKEVLVTDELFFEKLQAPGSAQRIDRALDARKEIERFCNRLSSKEKIIFDLFFKKGLGLEDIAKIIRSPVGTVSSAVTRMRAKIKYFKK